MSLFEFVLKVFRSLCLLFVILLFFLLIALNIPFVFYCFYMFEINIDQ